MFLYLSFLCMNCFAILEKDSNEKILNNPNSPYRYTLTYYIQFNICNISLYMWNSIASFQ